mmetsp:Transcript_23643/g.35769  ORF Transcript_23643/g.35769 Transcript_23643/m.35769 type:complete len:780 (+) Transcript_23643:127-2466(+)
MSKQKKPRLSIEGYFYKKRADEDEFAGLNDDVICGIDIETPFKSGNGSASKSSSSVGFHGSYPCTSSKHNSDSSNSIPGSKSNHQTDWQSSVATTNNDDEFAGIDDDDICEIDETPFKKNNTSALVSSSRNSLLSTVMKLSSSNNNVVTNDSNNNDGEGTSGGKDGGEEFSEEQNAVLSLNQLTQEEFDFDAMFESGGDTVSSNDAIIPGEDDDEVHDDDQNVDFQMIDDIDNSKESSSEVTAKELKQQTTLSQFYSKEVIDKKQPIHQPPQPKIADFVERNGRHFMRRDVWQHVAVTATNNNYESCSNLIMTIESFSKERIRGGKRELVAKVVPDQFYLPIEHVPWIGSDLAPIVIEHRRLNGNVGPEFVEYKLRTRCNTATAAASVPRFPLHMLGNHIKDPVSSDLIFGYDDTNSTKGGCFFKFKNDNDSAKRNIAIPTNSRGEFTALEMYSGAGGFSLGLKDAGFCVTHHVDNDTAACSTLQANFPDSRVLQCNVEDFLTGCLHNSKNPISTGRYPPVGSIALIHGSSPCQGFSRANRNGGANDAANNAETHQFMRVVRHLQTPYVTYENVEGIASKKNRVFVQTMIAQFLEMEYQLRLCFVTASDYGDPQDRNRIFILAAKRGLELPCLPQPTHGSTSTLFPKKTVRDVIGFLETVVALEYEGEVQATIDGVTLSLQGHRLRSSSEYNKKDDVQLVADKPAPTVIKRRVIRHYTNNRRPLTRLERSLLQSFPVHYQFYGTDSEIRDQIGNAVPVGLARAIGRSVMDAIQQSKSVE